MTSLIDIIPILYSSMDDQPYVRDDLFQDEEVYEEFFEQLMVLGMSPQLGSHEIKFQTFEENGVTYKGKTFKINITDIKEEDTDKGTVTKVSLEDTESAEKYLVTSQCQRGGSIQFMKIDRV
jgi:hypothetical protein